MKKFFLTFALAAAGTALTSDLALAAFPASVVGTWTGIANQSAVSFTVTAQAPTGPCRNIVGTMAGNSTIEGFYCPGTGRIYFLRKTTATNDTFQVYDGQAASTTAATNRLNGSFASIGSTNGEFGWSLTK
jgi:hypothetical protein